MRILTLDLEGFGPFRDRQVLRFDRAAAGGILLIAGRTGAGKSSLLDAVSFALYGAVPRYDGQPGRVRSDHSEPTRPTRVTLDFEMGGARYRVERRPEWQRPKQRGTGTTLQKQEARLWRWDEAASDWEGIASRPVDVAPELQEILGLSHAQFLQVVLLAQGGFQRFLHAQDQERQATLRTLFRTQRFAEVERLLAERRRELDETVGRAEARISGLLEQAEAAIAEAPDPASETAGSGQTADSIDARRGAVAAAVAALGSESDGLRRRAAETARAAGAADERARLSRTLAAAQRRLSEARERERSLAEGEAAVERDRAILAGADRAAPVELASTRLNRLSQQQEEIMHGLRAAREHLIEAAERAGESQRVAALVERPLAHGEYAERGQDAEIAVAAEGLEPAVLQPWRDEVAASLAALDEARDREADLASLEAEAERLRGLLSERREAGAALRNRAEVLPGLRDEARTSVERLARLAAPLDELRRTLERAERTAEAALRAGELTTALATARRLSSERAEDAADAAARVRDLLARRLEGMAGELAEGLRAGEPCPVCGAVEHPEPADRDDPVSSEQIERAERGAAVANTGLDDARASERQLETDLAEARAQAEGRAPVEAERALAEARSAVSAAAEAERELAERRRRLAELETELESTAERERGLSETVLAAEHELTIVERDRAAVAERLRAMRGAFETLAERRQAELLLRNALDETLRRGAELTAARAEYDTTWEECREATARAGFESFAAAIAASMPEEARSELRRRIEEHEAERQQIAGVLADPELQGLPADPVPLDRHEAELTAAQGAAREAERAAVTAEDRVRERRGQLERLDVAVAEAAAGMEALRRLRRLSDTVQGKEPNTRRMRLEAFVLAARLEAIVDAANRRLRTMVGGRYTLQHDDGLRSRGRQSGLGLRVLDEYTGRARSTDSLSGGETFLASLALALGLADVVTAESGGIALDTLFIDEGFGSLDPDALDQAMATLDTLREGGRTVALISHVTEMKERIPAQLEVIVDHRGISSLRGDGVQEPDEAQEPDDVREPGGLRETTVREWETR
ncbi:SMC family ATPase [Leucobacter sp. CSA1]|uniref:Nuclease SbcCD subunit C n=1 Tax=Leucobacter chromiisoli TaxID=2796471 RepID=A0A934UVI7_9MICO|nr:SMC family ATPase [Leucobacter chromiisoli]MBK0418982.1 SMC family ATPase [Leucobacter chromiisoli]